MAIKYVVFDWDGTLVDTIPLIKKAYDCAFDCVNLPHISYDEVKILAGKFSNKDIFQIVFGENKAKKAKIAFYRFINENHLKYLKTFDGAEDILKYCNKNNIYCYILSNKTREYLDKEVLQLGWNKYFKNIIGAGEKEFDKPHPNTCMSLFNNQPPASKEILVLGDGEADVAMANAWNAKAVIFDSQQKYNGQKPSYKIKELKEFIAIIARQQKQGRL